jgi:polyphosphate kinase
MPTWATAFHKEHYTSAAQATVSIGDEGVLNVPVSPSLSDIWIDRDLSWLDFNDRVLAEAVDERTPLLERAKFLAIFTANLDEFFMKRIAILRETITPERLKLLERIREKLVPMLQRRADCFHGSIVPALANHGVHLCRWDDLTAGQQLEAGEYFDAQISPALTPLVIDPTQPFPFLSNLSTSLVFLLRDPERAERMYARIKVPSVLRQWIPLQADVAPGQTLLVPLYEVMRGNVHKFYRGMELTATTLMRLTRDAEVEIDDSDEALSELVKEQIRQRRYEPVVRLEFAPGADSALREMLRTRFHLLPVDIYDMPDEVDYTALSEIAGMQLPALRDPAWSPIPPPALANGHADIFAVLQANDLLVHHPYDSFDASVEHFIRAAADDPLTVSIKMTVYRIGDDTPFVRSLIKAAEAGKQVACVIELKARFDEERNLHWAAELERAGAHVIFGVRGLKTHAKTALVVRKEPSGLRSYAHIGTGNYHVRTARLYTNVGLLTCDPALTRDVVNLFHYLTGHSQAPDCGTLLMAPSAMRSRFLELIKREMENQCAGRPARIIAKMNQLEDPDIIESLCEAACAGVAVDLVIRGLCCLRPGTAGRSEGIRVRSIIGRFLEHSRIFHFAAGHEDPLDGDFYIGSADWMFRNLSRRVEVVTPMTAPGPKQRLWEILDICLRDQRQAWILNSDGSYSQLHSERFGQEPEAAGLHITLMELTRRRSRPLTK